MSHMKAIVIQTCNQQQKPKQIILINNDDTNSKNNNIDNNNTDDGSIPNLESLRTQSELEKGTHFVSGSIDMNNKTLTGILSTDLPGLFPFTSSIGNNYIYSV